MIDKEVELFERWRTNSNDRFSQAYIDARLLRETQKSDSINRPKQKAFSKTIDFRTAVRRTIKLSGLYGVGRNNACDIQVNQNQLVLNHLSQSFDGYRILHISDTHFNGDERLMDNLVKAISSLDYDLCVLTGDYRFRSFGSNHIAIDGLSQIMKVVNTDTLAILGNHDSLYSVPAMEGLGIQVLLNERTSISKGTDTLNIVGVDDSSYYRTHDFQKACGVNEFNEQDCSLLLAHSPELYEEAAEIGFDAYLCGHTHGGQICLPGGYALRSNVKKSKWCVSGGWRYKGVSGYTSTGVGTSIVEVRFFCPPEIVVHTLVSK